MPVAAGPQALSTPFSTLKSVYGVECSRMDNELGLRASEENYPVLNIGQTTSSGQDNTKAQLPFHTHKHRNSISTHTSDSTDSSPTTTISTIDSSSMTDSSPSSSPESPVTVVPLSSFTATSFNIQSLDDLTMSDKPTPSRPINLSYDRPMTSPSPRRPRNAKGLALNLPSSSGNASPESNDGSMPTSPSGFVIPPKMKPRRKPSILSLQTSANNSLAPPGRLMMEPPPTPGGTQILRHHHSSPQMTMFTPGMPPAGGMQLPVFERSRVSGLSAAFRKPNGLTKSTSLGNDLTIEEDEESAIKPQMATRSLADIRGDMFDAPKSQEDIKSPGYPNGPVQIYEPNVYLYLEPTAEEASEFDVILNVASEVKNPFVAAQQAEQVIPPPRLTFDDFMDRDNTEPDTGMSTMSFATAWEWLPDSQQTPTKSSPTTPKAHAKRPEYVHIPWEHNTDISKDLMELCDLIDRRVKDGKKVLVHCQQGASRSASLIIAYGIYSNPSLTVNDAYHAAQKKSKWISPNMKLMYALQDFKKEVEKKSAGGVKRTLGRSPSKHRNTLSVDAIALSPKGPMTAPLPSEKGGNRVAALGSLTRARSDSTPNLDLSPGPSSAPSRFAWGNGPLRSPTFGLWPAGSDDILGSEPVSDFGASFGAGFTSSLEQSRSPTDIPAPFESSFGPNIDQSKQTNEKVDSSERESQEPMQRELPKSDNPVVDADAFAAFDFGFSFDTGADSRFAHSKTTSLDLLSIPGAFPASPRYDAPSFKFTNPPSASGSGFGSHRKGRRAAPTLSSSPLTPTARDFLAQGLPSPGLPGLRPQFASMRISDAPPTPGLWSPRLQSPRIQEMTAYPISEAIQPPEAVEDIKVPNDHIVSSDVAGFGMSAQDAAECFGFSTLVEEKTPVLVDPRSPAMKGDVPITRSINDML